MKIKPVTVVIGGLVLFFVLLASGFSHVVIERNDEYVLLISSTAADGVCEYLKTTGEFQCMSSDDYHSLQLQRIDQLQKDGDELEESMDKLREDMDRLKELIRQYNRGTLKSA